jgi:hypothetical protein
LAAEKYYSITEPDGEPTSNAVKFWTVKQGERDAVSFKVQKSNSPQQIGH